MDYFNLVTGASGFIGKTLVSELISRGRFVRAIHRGKSPSSNRSFGVQSFSVDSVDESTDWSAYLDGVRCIIHCAGLTNGIINGKVSSLAAFRAVNVAATKALAEQAAAFGVSRFIFLSSVKVHGDRTTLDSRFELSDELAPCDPYGVSKREAEQALWAVSEKTGLEVVVIRLPLVYGVGVKGNLLRLLGWVASEVPLPFGAVHNQRSLLSLSNLVDLLLLCAEHPAAAGQTFMASDGDDLSTPELIRLMAEGMDKSPWLLPVPVPLLQVGGSFLGKRSEVNRLVGSLQVDSEHTQTQLDWTPPVSVEDGVREMAQWYIGLQDARE